MPSGAAHRSVGAIDRVVSVRLLSGMRSVRLVSASALTLGLVCLLSVALVGLGFHIHDAHGPESHCVICKYAAHFTFLAVFTGVSIPVPATGPGCLNEVTAVALVAGLLCPCGLRAPPACS